MSEAPKGRLHEAAQSAASLPMDMVRAVILLGAVAVAGAGLLALGGPFSRLLDALTHFALLAFFVALVLLALALVTRRKGGRRSVIIAGAGVALWGLLLAPEYLSAAFQSRVQAGPDTVRIIQFNLWLNNTDPEGSADWIRGQDADFVVVEEVADRSRRVVRLLENEYPYAVGCRDPYPCSTMILSREAPVESGGYAIPFGLANLAWARFDRPGGPFTLVGLHHSWPYPVGQQSAQVEWTQQTLKDFETGSLILAGDFNATPWSRSMARQQRLYGLERRTRALPSFPARMFGRRPVGAPVPFLALDHVFAGEEWETVDVRRGPRLGSDHYPVVVDLRRSAVRD